MVKRKILMVGTFPPAIGGISTHIQTILKSNLNEEFIFIGFSTNRPTTALNKDVYDYKIIFHIGVLLLLKSIITTFKNIIKFSIIINVKNIDVVHIHTPDYWPFWESSIYVLITKLFKKKSILHIHATSFHSFYNKGNRFIKSLIKSVLNTSNKVIILSINQEKKFLRLIPKYKLVVIQNVVIFKNFQINLDNNNSKYINVLFIGGKEAKRKGIYDIIKAIPIVINNFGTNIRFIFLGKHNIQRLMQICKKNKISNYVKFKGYVSEVDKNYFLNGSNIFVLPSYAEGLPIAMLEAMAAGLPIISTSVGSIPDVIKEGVNGFLIQPGDSFNLAEKIIILARDECLRLKMGAKNKEKIIKEYDVKILKNRLKNMYNKLT